MRAKIGMRGMRSMMNMYTVWPRWEVGVIPQNLSSACRLMVMEWDMLSYTEPVELALEPMLCKVVKIILFTLPLLEKRKV